MIAATACGALAQLTVGRMVDRSTLRRLSLQVSLALAPCLLLACAPGWWAAPVAGTVAASLFAQVTLNETMTARYIAPVPRARVYPVRFSVGFLGAAAAPWPFPTGRRCARSCGPQHRRSSRARHGHQNARGQNRFVRHTVRQKPRQFIWPRFGPREKLQWVSQTARINSRVNSPTPAPLVRAVAGGAPAAAGVHQFPPP